MVPRFGMLPKVMPVWYDHDVQGWSIGTAPIDPTSSCVVGSHKLTLLALWKRILPAVRDRDNCFVADTARR